MRKKGLKTIIFAVLGILVMVWIGYHAYKQKEMEAYTVITIPLYVNNELYVGEEPVLKKADEIYVPLQLCNVVLSEKDKGYVEIEDVSYGSLQYLKENLGWNVIQKETEIYIDCFEQPFDYSWTKHPYVAHAFGAIDGNTYTNSLEAFHVNYEAGHRVFEIDLTMTSDNELVVLHDWSENTVIKVCGLDIPDEKIGKALSREEFLNQKIKGKYTTLDFNDVLDLLAEYPDIYIITDTKETQEPYISQQFQYMVDAAEKKDIQLLERVIPQIYNEDMFFTIMDIYDWNSVIYTLYNQGKDFTEKAVIDFSYGYGIKVITTYEARAHDLFMEELLKRDRIIYMNTYNDEESAEYWRSKGSYGFYTDFLVP